MVGPICVLHLKIIIIKWSLFSQLSNYIDVIQTFDKYINGYSLLSVTDERSHLKENNTLPVLSASIFR